MKPPPSCMWTPDPHPRRPPGCPWSRVGAATSLMSRRDHVVTWRVHRISARHFYSHGRSSFRKHPRLYCKWGPNVITKAMVTGRGLELGRGGGEAPCRERTEGSSNLSEARRGTLESGVPWEPQRASTRRLPWRAQRDAALPTLRTSLRETTFGNRISRTIREQTCILSHQMCGNF